jgi:hypothetical protein
LRVANVQKGSPKLKKKKILALYAYAANKPKIEVSTWNFYNLEGHKIS